MRTKGSTRGVLLITAGLIGSLLYVSTAGGVARFGDIEDGVFYTKPVQWMVDEDITTGTEPGCFSPHDFVTRGQAAAFMWRMEGSKAAAPHPFLDVFAVWQQGPVSWMFANAITTGTTATTYAPDLVLTRGQLAALLWRLAGEPGGNPPHPFIDVFAAWQQEAVAWMSFLGITTGVTDTLFAPDDPVTRGQLAAFFYRYKGSPAVVVDPFTPPCPDDGTGGTTTTTTQGGTTTTTTTMGGGSTTTTTTTTTTTAPPDGMALFANTPTAPGTSTQSCSTCHGGNGQGTGQGPAINPNSLTPGEIETQIRTGGFPGGMPDDFEDRLTDAEIEAIRDFVAAW